MSFNKKQSNLCCVLSSTVNCDKRLNISLKIRASIIYNLEEEQKLVERSDMVYIIEEAIIEFHHRAFTESVLSADFTKK